MRITALRPGKRPSPSARPMLRPNSLARVTFRAAANTAEHGPTSRSYRPYASQLRDTKATPAGRGGAAPVRQPADNRQQSMGAFSGKNTMNRVFNFLILILYPKPVPYMCISTKRKWESRTECEAKRPLVDSGKRSGAKTV